MGYRLGYRRVPAIVALCLLVGAAGCSGRDATTGAAPAAGSPSTSGADRATTCTEPLGELARRNASRTAYEKAVNLEVSPTTTMTIGLRTPRTVNLGGPGVHPGDAVVLVRLRARLERGTSATLSPDDFTMAGPDGKGCRDLHPGEIYGVNMLTGSALATATKTLQADLAFVVPEGSAPKDYTVYYQPADHPAKVLTWSKPGPRTKNGRSDPIRR